jgi:hypothetical protein
MAHPLDGDLWMATDGALPQIQSNAGSLNHQSQDQITVIPAAVFPPARRGERSPNRRFAQE